MKVYDVIVIGSGGGAKISTPASMIGLKAAIIEEWKAGGTCLNRGCIPSKMLIHPANVVLAIKEAKKFGIEAKYNSVDFGRLMKRINLTTDSDSASISRSYKNAKNLDYYRCHAEFVSDKVIKANGKEITAKKIFIASGARPSIPKIEGLDKVPYMTSTEALLKKELPKKLLVLGAGYIAAELGHAYAAFGSDVNFIVRGNTFLQMEDSDISREFTKVFSKLHKCHYNVEPFKVEYKDKKFIAHLKDKKGNKSRLDGDGLLVATGIRPNTDNLGLKNTRIKTDNEGFIIVNKCMETSVKDVYAIGDVVGNYMFRHSVNFESEFLFGTLFIEKKKRPISYPPMPHAVFTHPEIGSVGNTEDELKSAGKKEGKDYIIGISLYKQSAQGIARLSETDFVKLIFDKKTRKLIGAHIMGEEAATMLHQLIFAMTYEATVDQLLSMIYIHPALPEIVRNAAKKAKDRF